MWRTSEADGMITGKTTIVAHIGFPTDNFKAPMIYNPYFETTGTDCVVIPMSCPAGDFANLFHPLFGLDNLAGAIITMPHKVAVVAMLDHVTEAVRICGACNAVRREPDGGLHGTIFDGEGFVRGMERKGRSAQGTSAIIAGSGGVGSAIAASLAAAGASQLALYDKDFNASDNLARRLKKFYPTLKIDTGSRDPSGFDIVVNATPLGMQDDDPLPFDPSRISSSAYVGEVVMRRHETRFVEQALNRGCEIQVGVDMLFEQIPAYLEFFGFPAATPDELRKIARISY